MRNGVAELLHNQVDDGETSDVVLPLLKIAWRLVKQKDGSVDTDGFVTQMYRMMEFQSLNAVSKLHCVRILDKLSSLPRFLDASAQTNGLASVLQLLRTYKDFPCSNTVVHLGILRGITRILSVLLSSSVLKASFYQFSGLGYLCNAAHFLTDSLSEIQTRHTGALGETAEVGVLKDVMKLLETTTVGVDTNTLIRLAGDAPLWDRMLLVLHKQLKTLVTLFETGVNPSRRDNLAFIGILSHASSTLFNILCVTSTQTLADLDARSSQKLLLGGIGVTSRMLLNGAIEVVLRHLKPRLEFRPARDLAVDVDCDPEIAPNHAILELRLAVVAAEAFHVAVVNNLVDIHHIQKHVLNNVVTTVKGILKLFSPVHLMEDSDDGYSTLQRRILLLHVLTLSILSESEPIAEQLRETGYFGCATKLLSGFLKQATNSSIVYDHNQDITGGGSLRMEINTFFNMSVAFLLNNLVAVTGLGIVLPSTTTRFIQEIPLSIVFATFLAIHRAIKHPKCLAALLAPATKGHTDSGEQFIGRVATVACSLGITQRTGGKPDAFLQCASQALLFELLHGSIHTTDNYQYQFHPGLGVEFGPGFGTVEGQTYLEGVGGSREHSESDTLEVSSETPIGQPLMAPHRIRSFVADFMLHKGKATLLEGIQGLLEIKDATKTIARSGDFKVLAAIAAAVTVSVPFTNNKTPHSPELPTDAIAPQRRLIPVELAAAVLLELGCVGLITNIVDGTSSPTELTAISSCLKAEQARFPHRRWFKLLVAGRGTARSTGHRHMVMMVLAAAKAAAERLKIRVQVIGPEPPTSAAQNRPGSRRSSVEFDVERRNGSLLELPDITAPAPQLQSKPQLQHPQTMQTTSAQVLPPQITPAPPITAPSATAQVGDLLKQVQKLLDRNAHLEAKLRKERERGTVLTGREETQAAKETKLSQTIETLTLQCQQLALDKKELKANLEEAANEQERLREQRASTLAAMALLRDRTEEAQNARMQGDSRYKLRVEKMTAQLNHLCADVQRLQEAQATETATQDSLEAKFGQHKHSVAEWIEQQRAREQEETERATRAGDAGRRVAALESELAAARLRHKQKVARLKKTIADHEKAVADLTVAQAEAVCKVKEMTTAVSALEARMERKRAKLQTARESQAPRRDSLLFKTAEDFPSLLEFDTLKAENNRLRATLEGLHSQQGNVVGVDTTMITQLCLGTQTSKPTYLHTMEMLEALAAKVEESYSIMCERDRTRAYEPIPPPEGESESDDIVGLVHGEQSYIEAQPNSGEGSSATTVVDKFNSIVASLAETRANALLGGVEYTQGQRQSDPLNDTDLKALYEAALGLLQESTDPTLLTNPRRMQTIQTNIIISLFVLAPHAERTDGLCEALLLVANQEILITNNSLARLVYKLLEKVITNKNYNKNVLSVIAAAMCNWGDTSVFKLKRGLRILERVSQREKGHAPSLPIILDDTIVGALAVALEKARAFHSKKLERRIARSVLVAASLAVRKANKALLLESCLLDFLVCADLDDSELLGCALKLLLRLNPAELHAAVPSTVLVMLARKVSDFHTASPLVADLYALVIRAANIPASPVRLELVVAPGSADDSPTAPLQRALLSAECVGALAAIFMDCVNRPEPHEPWCKGLVVVSLTVLAFVLAQSPSLATGLRGNMEFLKAVTGLSRQGNGDLGVCASRVVLCL